MRTARCHQLSVPPPLIVLEGTSCRAGRRTSSPNAAVARDFQAWRALGVTGTPTLLINERRVQGTPPLDELEDYVRRALRE